MLNCARNVDEQAQLGSQSEAMTSHIASELWIKHAERVPLFQDAGAFVGQRDHGRFLQGILADP
jgi:hypothetical protein